MNASVRRNSVTEKPQHVGALKRIDTPANQSLIEAAQTPRLAEHHVGSPFRLLTCPVIIQRAGPAKELGVQRMHPSQQPIQLPPPVDLRLLVRQFLGTFKVADPNETIIPSQVADPFGVHLLGKPLAAVEHYVHVKGEPTRQPYLRQAKAAIVPIGRSGKCEWPVASGAVVPPCHLPPATRHPPPATCHPPLPTTCPSPAY